MRVLMLVPQLFYSARGTPLSAYHRIKDLRARGHEVEVLTYKIGEPPPDLPDVVVHRAFGPHLFRQVKQGPSYVKIWFDLWIFASLLVRLARSRYDALWAHEEGGFMGALVTRLFRTPLVYDLHSSLPLQIRDWGFSEREWVVGIFRFVERFTLRRAAVSVAISPGVRHAALESWPFANVVTIVNRFEQGPRATEAEARAVRAELGVAPGQPMVLYTGSFVALQALDLLVDAAPAVRARVPEARFVLVGGRSEEIEALAARARGLGIPGEALLLLPHRPPAQMPAFMEACNVLVSPRVRGINPPGKLFSYLSSGRPIVATDQPIHNQILDARCAILTPPDARGLADGIVTALLDAERVRTVVAGAEAVLREEYGPERRRAAYGELERLLREARS